MLRTLLRLPELKNWDRSLDHPETTVLHGEIIRKKPFLKKLYINWYTMLSEAIQSVPAGEKLEIGSGAGFIKEVIPEVITSDVLDLPGIDKLLNGESLPYENKDLAAIVMVDTLHHIPNPASFFKEASRCLKKGGRIAMIEPANTVWGRFIYQKFHHEPFNPKGEWTIPSTGPLSGANGALPWILFNRDRDKFCEDFPELTIKEIKYHTPLRYLLSGGVSMKSLVPSFCFGFLSAIDKILVALSKQTAMFQLIILEKNS